MEYESIDPEQSSSSSSTMDERIARRTAEGYSVDFQEYISRGFELFKKDMMTFILLTVILMACTGGLGSILYNVSWFVNLLLAALAAPLNMGIVHIGYKLDRGEPYELSQFFDPFQHFIPLAVAGILVNLLTSIGFILCILPGIYLAVAYAFTFYIIWFGKKEDFWGSMEASRKLITEEWFNFFVFVLVIVLINIAGALVLGVGLLVSIPISLLSMYAAFDDIVGIPGTEEF